MFILQKYHFLKKNTRWSNWREDTPETPSETLAKLQNACNHPILTCIGKKGLCSKIFEDSYVSSKMKAVMDILNSILSGQAEKVLIFAYFTGVLDLLELQLIGHHIQFRRLDGGMEVNPRERAVKDFKTNPEVCNDISPI